MFMISSPVFSTFISSISQVLFTQLCMMCALPPIQIPFYSDFWFYNISHFPSSMWSIKVCDGFGVVSTQVDTFLCDFVFMTELWISPAVTFGDHPLLSVQLIIIHWDLSWDERIKPRQFFWFSVKCVCICSNKSHFRAQHLTIRIKKQLN
jgi:hypothetical protein